MQTEPEQHQHECDGVEALFLKGHNIGANQHGTDPQAGQGSSSTSVIERNEISDRQVVPRTPGSEGHEAGAGIEGSGCPESAAHQSLRLSSPLLMIGC